MKKIVTSLIIIVVILISSYSFWSNTRKKPQNVLIENQRAALSLGYEVKADGVYHNTLIIHGMDPKTFWYIGGDFIKDASHVYFWSNLISGADPKTFVFISDTYAKDSKNVYLGANVLTSADPKTFELVGGCYSKDRDHVFCLSNTVTGANPKTLQLVKAIQNGGYVKDEKSVFYSGKIVKDADPLTFVYLGGGFSKDKNSAYYDGGDDPGSTPFSVIKGVDLRTFEYVGGDYYAKDFVHVYGGDQIIPGIDPKKCIVQNIDGCKEK